MRNESDNFRKIFQECSDKVLLHDLTSNKKFTYGELGLLSNKFAGLLVKKYQLQPNDKVMIFLDNRAEAYVTYLACLQAGLVTVPVNSDFGVSDVKKIFSSIDISVIVTSKLLQKKLLDLPKDNKNGQAIFSFDGNQESSDTISLDDILKSDIQPFSSVPFENMMDNLLMEILFTSGTTGTPKAVPIIAHKILGNARIFLKHHNIQEGEIFYNTLPVCYLAGWFNLFIIPLLSRGTVVLDQSFGAINMYQFWEIVQKNNVTILWFTPTILSMLLAIGIDEDLKLKEISQKIKFSFVGTAPLHKTLKRRFEDTFLLKLCENYGLSETMFIASCHPRREVPYDAVGRVLPGIHIKIKSEEKTKQATGEILLKSPYMLNEYLNQRELNSFSFEDDGYFNTGDLGYLDENNNLFVTGRKKDIIIRGGINISPMEIEEVIISHLGVNEVAVIAQPHEFYGEVAVAAVSLNNKDIGVKEILNFCTEKLTAIKRPESIYIFDMLPRNSSGKIDKRAISASLLKQANK